MDPRGKAFVAGTRKHPLCLCLMLVGTVTKVQAADTPVCSMARDDFVNAFPDIQRPLQRKTPQVAKPPGLVVRFPRKELREGTKLGCIRPDSIGRACHAISFVNQCLRDIRQWGNSSSNKASPIFVLVGEVLTIPSPVGAAQSAPPHLTLAKP
jgi:hypothetical protein